MNMVCSELVLLAVNLSEKGIDEIIKSDDNDLMISLTTNGWFVKKYSEVLKKSAY